MCEPLTPPPGSCAGLNSNSAMPEAAPADDDPDAWRPSAAALEVQDAVIATLQRVCPFAYAVGRLRLYLRMPTLEQVRQLLWCLAAPADAYRRCHNGSRVTTSECRPLC